MPSTNGHAPRRAILYTRVSGDSQRDQGYSLSDQRRELEAWAAREGYQVLEVLEDGAWSGASLVRPGLDRLRELVRDGGVGAVAVLFRDRLARGVYAGLLAEEFAEHGCRLIALNAQVDDSPEGELHGGMLDIIAAWERKKIAERTRRGKLQKSREGKIVATHRPPFGFLYNAARDNYVVEPGEMRVALRIFEMVAGGAAINAVKRTFDREGVPTPGGARFWSEVMIRKVLTNDLYRAHSFEEIAQLVSSGVAASLNESQRYGVSWFGRRKVTQKQVSENGTYRVKTRSTIRAREEQIAVPTPDPGIPRELVDAAREAIKGNRRSPTANRRFWELSGGLARCGLCAGRMQPDTKTNPSGLFYYYRCAHNRKNGTAGCANYKSYPAPEIEARVWEFVRERVMDPDTLRADLDLLVEMERDGMRGNPQQEAKAWLEALSKVNRKRAAYQDQQAEGLITLDELRTKLAALDDTRETARRELAALQGRTERLKALERDKEAILEHYGELAPEALDGLAPEERHRFYATLKLEVTLRPDRAPEVTGVHTAAPVGHKECALAQTRR